MAWYYDPWEQRYLDDKRSRHKTKKQRKAEYKEFRRNRAIRNWRREEPAKWRLISRYLWKRRFPKGE